MDLVFSHGLFSKVRLLISGCLSVHVAVHALIVRITLVKYRDPHEVLDVSDVVVIG